VEGGAEPDLAHEATDILRDYLASARERNLPMFMDLLSGGWRRTAALTGIGLLVSFLFFREILPSRDPRHVTGLEARRTARDLADVCERLSRPRGQRVDAHRHARERLGGARSLGARTPS